MAESRAAVPTSSTSMSIATTLPVRMPVFVAFGACRIRPSTCLWSGVRRCQPLVACGLFPSTGTGVYPLSIRPWRRVARSEVEESARAESLGIGAFQRSESCTRYGFSEGG